MPGSKKKSKNLSVVTSPEHVKKFFGNFTLEEAQENLWKLFHHSMTSNQIGEIDSVERESSFFYYARLKEFITNSYHLI